MARDRKDRSVSWFMTHHGGSLLRLAPIGPFVSWRASPTVLAFPKQIPDGLLEVTFADKPTPAPFLIEIETYPEQDTWTQIRKDVAMVLLTRGVVPDVLLLVLHPKGNLAIDPEQTVPSARGLTTLHLRIHVVNLWAVPAEDLLAAGDVGLIPWVPLAHYDGSPEALLRQCRERIEQQADPAERDTLVAITRVMAEARYNDLQLLSVLGVPPMTLEKVFLQSPTVQRLLDNKAQERAEKLAPKLAKELAEPLARERAEQLAKELAEPLARERAEQLAKELAEPLAKERAEQLAKELAEPLAKERAEQLAEQKVAEKEHQLVAAAERRAAEETARETIGKAVLRVLHQRLGPVPEEIAGQLQAIHNQEKLDDLLGLAAVCPDLEAFRQALSQP